LVQYRTDLEGWTGPDGKYYGKGEDGERQARYANSTHKKCECGNIMSRGWSVCDTCRNKRVQERYESLEAVEWDGKSYMCVDDNFFTSMEEVFEYCEDNEITISECK